MAAKSNAQRQAEYRARKQAQKACERAGCWAERESGFTLCPPHRAEAKERHLGLRQRAGLGPLATAPLLRQRAESGNMPEGLAKAALREQAAMVDKAERLQRELAEAKAQLEIAHRTIAELDAASADGIPAAELAEALRETKPSPKSLLARVKGIVSHLSRKACPRCGATLERMARQGH